MNTTYLLLEGVPSWSEDSGVPQCLVCIQFLAGGQSSCQAIAGPANTLAMHSQHNHQAIAKTCPTCTYSMYHQHM